jgi:gas vesicle protein
MSRDHDGYAGVVLMAFVMGAITGVAVGLLWTPTTGEERRRFLNERAREGREKVSVAAQRGREFVQQQREHLSTAIDRGREAYQRDREGNNDAAEEQGSSLGEPERTQDTPSPTKSGKSEE